jgi:two-component system response regulator YesN
MYKVLIAEDEEMIRKGLVYSVPWAELDCCVVGEAGDGIEGTELIEKLRPDIVVADISMPAVGGLEMLARTRGLSYSAIILTGYSEFQYAKQAIHLGVISYLLKPLSVAELKQAVEQAKKHCQVQEAYLTKATETDSLLNQTFIKKMEPNVAMESLVKGLLQYIEENYSRKILIQDVVKHFHYSETFIVKKFKAETGITFNEYLIRYRIQKAMELMKEKENTLNDISVRCGFSDYKYFGVVFKKLTGSSPREFMEAVLFREGFMERDKGIK